MKKAPLGKAFSIVFLSLALTSGCLARKVAVNDFTEKKVSAIQRLIYDIHDFLIGELLSLTDVSPETEQFVREIQNKMGMEHITIRLRCMTRSIMTSLGRENAAAMAIPFANTILISEEWFNSLPEKEKTAIVGHELAHIRNKHIYKGMAVSIASYSLLRICKFSCLSAIFLAQLLRQVYSRYCESEADRISAIELNNVDGCIDLFKRFKNLRDPHSRFVFKRAMRRIGKFITYPIRKLYASHPSLSNRIKDLEKLDQDQMSN